MAPWKVKLEILFLMLYFLSAVKTTDTYSSTWLGRSSGLLEATATIQIGSTQPSFAFPILPSQHSLCLS